MSLTGDLWRFLYYVYDNLAVGGTVFLGLWLIPERIYDRIPGFNMWPHNVKLGAEGFLYVLVGSYIKGMIKESGGGSRAGTMLY